MWPEASPQDAVMRCALITVPHQGIRLELLGLNRFATCPALLGPLSTPDMGPFHRKERGALWVASTSS